MSVQGNILGRLGQTPELKAAQSGTKYVILSVACDRRKGQEKITDWFKVKAFDKTAETIASHLKKGDPFYAAVAAEVDHWESKGEKRSEVVLVVTRFEFVPGPPRGAGGSSETVRDTGHNARPMRDPGNTDYTVDEDIPF